MRLESHRVGLALDVRTVRVEDEPLVPPIHPRGQAEGLEEVERGSNEVLRDRALLEHLELRAHQEPAVERRDRCRERERLDEHRHPARGAAARHREQDSRFVQALYRLDRTRGQLLLLRDEGAVDVREDEPDHLSAR